MLKYLLVKNLLYNLKWVQFFEKKKKESDTQVNFEWVVFGFNKYKRKNFWWVSIRSVHKMKVKNYYRFCTFLNNIFI